MTGNIEVLITAVAAGRTLREASAAASMSIRTAQRRLSEPDVVARVEQKRADLGEAESASWHQLRTQAMARLAELVNTENAHVAVQAVALVFRAAAQHELALEFRRDLNEVASTLMSVQIALTETGRAPDA